MEIEIESNFLVPRDYAEAVKTEMSEMASRGRKAVKFIADKAKKEALDQYSDEMKALFDHQPLSRRYTLQDAAAMIGVSTTTIRQKENAGILPEPAFRQDTAAKVRMGYTINEINRIRDILGLRPTKPSNAPAPIIGFLNQKGGSTKTTTTQLMSHFLATQGYKVLLVDADAQGSLSFLFNRLPNIDVGYEDTLAPFMLLDVWDEESDGEYKDFSNLDYAIQNTPWSDIDIIPACMDNLTIDMYMQSEWAKVKAEPIDLIMRLRRGLERFRDKYDFILIDGSPSLSVSTMNTISACDLVLTPVPAQMVDYASTVEFSGMVENAINTYLDDAGGKKAYCPNLPEFAFFITRFSKSAYAAEMDKIIRSTFRSDHTYMLKNEIYRSDEQGKSSNQIKSVYEINPSEANNRTKLKKDLELLERALSEMKDLAIELIWGDVEGVSE